MAKISNPHDGHRKRLKKKFADTPKEQFDEFLDKCPSHELLELLLFYSIPRQNTNEIAHNLLDRFSTIDAVFDADIHEIETVDGIGRQSAEFIHFISAAIHAYSLSKSMLNIKKILNSETAGEYFVSKFRNRISECLILVSLDAENRILATDKICDGSLNSVNIDFRNIISTVLMRKAVAVILAHNHPGGTAMPSNADRRATELIKNALLTVNVRLVDHIIVANDKYISMNFDLHMI